jgi:hypothetical protein
VGTESVRIGKAKGAPMKAEAMLYSLAALGLASLGPTAGLPPEQQIYLWSVAGTVIGACIAAIQMPNGTSYGQRALRAGMSLFSGLLLAPYAISYIPRPDDMPQWWHAFAVSGIAAALAYVVMTEAPKIVKIKIREAAK